MSEFDAESFDPNKRRLCPDGNCVGILDDAGRCRVCAMVATPGAEGDVAAVGHEVDEELDDLAAWENGPDGPNSGHHTGEHVDSGHAGAAFDPTRRLCPDGDCVGVLDTVGRCKACGRVAPADLSMTE